MNHKIFLLGMLLTIRTLMSAHGGEISVATVNGAIGPITANFMIKSIDAAEEQKAECIIFELDTPGGLDDSMRQIIKRIMAAKIPVVVFVAPAGSRAASAGAFISLSAHIAAMAPGTAIGAAHPVAIGQSGQADSNMSAKATHDAAAYIRSIAAQRGRNTDWADSAVKQSVSLSETEALARKVIDLIAPNTQELIRLISGRKVLLDDGREVTLQTANAEVRRRAMSRRDEILQIIANPNIAYLLFMLGLLGIYFELSNPGAIFPGVVGAIAIILAFFAFQTLSVNYAGILLIMLALALFLLDVYMTSGGILTAGGIVALILGSLMLFNNSADPALRVSLQVMIPIVLVTSLFFVLGVLLSFKSMRRRPVSGSEGLIGQTGDVRAAVTAEGGSVFVAGTHWNAVSDAHIPQGASIRVVAVRSMTLKVEQV